MPATIPSLSLETPVGGEAGGGCFVGFCSSRRVTTSYPTKKNGGGQFFREEVEQVQYTKKKTGKLENDLETWVGPYISYPRGVRMFGGILFVRPPLGKVPWKSGFQLPSVSHGNISRSTRKGVHKTAARISFRSSSLPWICRYC